MIQLRKAAERGHFDHGWLDTYHSFSFADYHDPAHMGFRSLRVINDDRVQPGRGFGMHGHKDMEIVTYVLEGALEHKDSLGNGSVIVPGDVQRMSAGRGVQHSEFNHSKHDPVHLLQIWILTEQKGLDPSYEQKNFRTEDKQDQLRLIASHDGREGSLTIHQDTNLYAARLSPGTEQQHSLKPERHAWVQVVSGKVSVNAQALESGDGIAVSQESIVSLRAIQKSEVLLFDLP